MFFYLFFGAFYIYIIGSLITGKLLAEDFSLMNREENPFKFWLFWTLLTIAIIGMNVVFVLPMEDVARFVFGESAG